MSGKRIQAPRPPVLGISGVDIDKPESENTTPVNQVPENGVPVFPSAPVDGVDPFAPLPTTPETDSELPSVNEVDPFAPLAPMEESGTGAPAEPDPFAPLPSPF